MPATPLRLIMGALLGCIATSAFAAQLILNEYNAVGSDKFLNGGDEFMDDDGNVPPPSDPFFGRVAGNGGDWFELVVIADGLDIRGWQLEIRNDGQVEPRLVFTDAAIWSDLAAGTIITVSEQVPDEVGYDPPAGDWWINVMAANPADGGTGEYITADNFPVSNDDWQLTILDAAGALVVGPAGEGIVGDDGVPSGVGVNSREVFALETDPSALIERDSPFYDDSIYSSFGQANPIGESGVQDLSALRLGLPLPDRDGDGIADDGDRSGIAGDAPCVGGAVEGCDDNCPGEQNALQLDAGGVGAGAAADGIGDACQCGDVSDDGVVTGRDAVLIRRDAAGLPPGLAAPEKCSVLTAGACGRPDAVVIQRALSGLPPGIAQVCDAAVLPEGDSDVLFDPDRVIEIAVTMDEDKWNELRNQIQTPQDLIDFPNCGLEPWPSPFTWFSTDATVDGLALVNLGIRKKGFLGSLSASKPALKLHFDRFVAGQRVHGVQRMTLNNARQDPAFARQCLTYQFFAAAGIASPRCNFAHVVVNGEDLGVYVNVEDIKEPLLARYFADATGKLYEGTFSDFWPGDWTGTFEPETDAAEEDKAEILALADDLRDLPDAELLPAVEAQVDLEQFLTHWAAEALIAHRDSYNRSGNNFFIYIDPSIGRVAFMPWGTDMGLDTEDEPTIDPRTALARRLYNLDPTRAQYLSRLQDLLDQVWDPAANLAELDRIEALLTPVLIDSGMLQELMEMRDAMDGLREWIATRRAVVQADIDAAPGSVPDTQRTHLCDFPP